MIYLNIVIKHIKNKGESLNFFKHVLHIHIL